MDSVLGLRGYTVCATLIAVGQPVPTALLASLRALDPAVGMVPTHGQQHGGCLIGLGKRFSG